MQKFVMIYLISINVIGFLEMYIDKRRAIKGKWRIKENRLFITAFFGGSLGLYMGMRIFRHKTKQPLFKYGIPLIILVQITLLVYFK